MKKREKKVNKVEWRGCRRGKRRRIRWNGEKRRPMKQEENKVKRWERMEMDKEKGKEGESGKVKTSMIISYLPLFSSHPFLEIMLF